MERLTEWNREHTHGQLVKGDSYTKLARYEDTDLEPEDVERLKGFMQSTAIQNEPLTLEELREMNGLPVWVELADGRREYGLVCIEEFGTKIYVRLQYDTFLAYNHDVPNKSFWSKICRHSPGKVERRESVDLEELKTFHDVTSYDCSDIAEKLISLTNQENDEGLRKELLDALYYIMAAAANPYNRDSFRVLNNILLKIAEAE